MLKQRPELLNTLISGYMRGGMSRRQFLQRVSVLAAAASAATAAGGQVSAQDSGDRRIRKIGMMTVPQANVPIEFESTQLSASQIQQLGVEVEVQVLPNDQLSDIVWYQRDKWDYTAWQMVGRPERLDPDEFIYNLFHSENVENGYNFVGYVNPEYDEIALAQRQEVDRDKRQQLVHQSQYIVATDQPYTFWAYPEALFAFNKQVFDENTVVDARGLGIKNYWTFVKAEPLGDMKDFILNTQTPIQGINPLYISGGPDSWVTDLIWDRLLRIGEDGLPTPSAATGVEWIDNVTIKVTLQEGLLWHDGEPVTTDDVIFSFQAPAEDSAPMYKPFVSGIESITAEGNDVTFTFKAPNAAFETSSLAKINLIPKHIWGPVLDDLKAKDQTAEEYQEEAPVGSGPFRFVNWARGQETILEAFPDHYMAPKVGKWILRDVSNAAAALGSLQSGELNFLADYTGDPELLAQTISGSPDLLKLVSTVQVGFRFLAPNHRRQPMNDPAFRLAVSMAVGKDQIVNNIYKGFASVADSVVSVALDYWHAPDLEGYPTSDIEGARSVLEAAGYSWDNEGHLLYPEGITETLAAD